MRSEVEPYLEARREAGFDERVTGEPIYYEHYRTDAPKAVIVISHGQLCFDGSMARLREQCASDSTVTILFASETPELPDQLRNVKKEGKRVTFTINRAMGESPLLAETISRNIVRDIAISEPPVENVIRDLYEGVGQ